MDALYIISNDEHIQKNEFQIGKCSITQYELLLYYRSYFYDPKIMFYMPCKSAAYFEFVIKNNLNLLNPESSQWIKMNIFSLIEVINETLKLEIESGILSFINKIKNEDYWYILEKDEIYKSSKFGFKKIQTCNLNHKFNSFGMDMKKIEKFIKSSRVIPNLPIFSVGEREIELELIKKHSCDLCSIFNNQIRLNNIPNVEMIINTNYDSICFIYDILCKYYTITFNDNDLESALIFEYLLKKSDKNNKYYYAIKYATKFFLLIMAKISNYSYFLTISDTHYYIIRGVKLKIVSHINKIQLNLTIINQYIMKYNVIYSITKHPNILQEMESLYDINKMQSICDDICEYFDRYILDIFIHDITFNTYKSELEKYRKNHKKMQNYELNDNQFLFACLLLGVDLLECNGIKVKILPRYIN